MRAQTFPSKKRSSGGEHNIRTFIFCNIASHAKEPEAFITFERVSFQRSFCRKGRHAKRRRAEHERTEGTRGWALSLEEAFFMHHALQALTVLNDERALQSQVILLPACHVTKRAWHKLPQVSAACINAGSTWPECPQELWERCRGLKVDFIESYIPYHHYRSRVLLCNLDLCKACCWSDAPPAPSLCTLQAQS